MAGAPSKEDNVTFTDLENLGNSLSDVYYQRYLITEKHTRFLTKSELDNHPPSEKTEYMYLGATSTCSDSVDSNAGDESEEVKSNEKQDREEENDGEEEEDDGIGAWMMYVPQDLLDTM